MAFAPAHMPGRWRSAHRMATPSYPLIPYGWADPL